MTAAAPPASDTDTNLDFSDQGDPVLDFSSGGELVTAPPAPSVLSRVGSAAGATWRGINYPLSRLTGIDPQTLGRYIEVPGSVPYEASRYIANKILPARAQIPDTLAKKEAASPILRGVEKGAGNIGESMTSPLSIATLGTGALVAKAPVWAQRTLSLAFAAMGAQQAGSAAGEFYEAAKRGDWETAVDKGTQIIAGTVQAGMGAHATVHGILPNSTAPVNLPAGTSPRSFDSLAARLTPGQTPPEIPSDLLPQAEAALNEVQPTTTTTGPQIAQPGLPLQATAPPEFQPSAPAIPIKKPPVQKISPTTLLQQEADAQRAQKMATEPSGLSMAVDKAKQAQWGDIPANEQMLAMLPQDRPSLQPPVGPTSPESVPQGGASQAVRQAGEAVQRAQDYPKAAAEKVSQEQVPPVYPDKPLTGNQLTIIQDSLRKAITDNQIPGERKGFIAGSGLEKWADGVLDDHSWLTQVNSDLGLKLTIQTAKKVAALAVKGTALIERGVTDFSRWSAEMIKEHGEDVKPWLKKVYQQSVSIRAGAFSQPQTQKVQNARSQQETAAIHGSVQPQQPPAGQLPQPQGERGIQPQTPGRVQTGETPPTGPQPAPLRPAVKPPTLPGVRFDHAYDGAGGKKLWQFTVQDNGPAHNAAFSVPEGASEEFIRAKIASMVAERNAPLTADEALAKPAGEVTPEHISAMSDDELVKLTSATDSQGVRKFRVQERGIQWGARQGPEALPDIQAQAKKAQQDMLAAMQDPQRTGQVPALQQRAQFLASAAEGIRGRNKLPSPNGNPTYDALVKSGKLSKPAEKTTQQKVPPGMDAGPGAATRPDLVGGPDLPTDPGNPDVYGIAARVREERAKSGRVAPVPPGKGVTAEDSVENGRLLLERGANPEHIMSNFEQTGRFSASDMAVVRAHGEQLARDARAIEEKYGTDSDEYRSAWNDLSAWDERSKRMQTEWHKGGQAQQGETDLDTGTFTGLQRAYHDETGKDFTPEQAAQADEHARKVTKAAQDSKAAQDELFKHIPKEPPPKPGAPEDPKSDANVWKKVKEYIQKGEDDYKDVVAKVSTDLGMPYDDVAKAIARNKTTKRLADDVWRKQLTARRMKEQARRWLAQTQIPAVRRALASIPRTMFTLKVGFHGTVALGTHAPMVAFQPRFWADYVRNFGKMYRMVADQAYYERQVQALVHRPNFIPAKRAGVVNDPFTYEDYNSPDMDQYIGRVSGMGNRGYFVLKILRQDMFDQHWNQLPESAKTPEVAAAIADSVNHATGVTKAMAPKGANLALFAPRLEASRISWLALDPAKAGATFANWKNATPEAKWQAINQVKEKAWVAGTYFSLLALNQGILAATGSKQKINGVPQAFGGAGVDPMNPDFLKFKAAGQDVAYGGAMLSLARLPVRLAVLRAKGGSGKMAHLIYPDESMTGEVERYVRSQLAPVAQPIADVAFKGDYENRPLPKMPLSGPALPMPKRLAARGEKPYTWKELALETVLPIPAEEPFKEVWSKGLGMSPEQMEGYGGAFAKSLVQGLTGSRLNEDTQATRQ